tara:strand:- start:82 stop:306 length:225 start_codon:yes stop_codon:yes gene_type:complete
MESLKQREHRIGYENAMSDYWIKYRVKHPLAPSEQNPPQTKFFSTQDELQEFIEMNVDTIEIVVSGDKYAPKRE